MALSISNVSPSPFQGGTRASPFISQAGNSGLVQPTVNVGNGGMTGVGNTGYPMSVNPAVHGLVNPPSTANVGMVKSHTVSTDGQGGQTVKTEYHAPQNPPQPTGGLLYNGVPTSGAPGTLGNNGPVSGATDQSTNPNPQSFTTPSGAVVHADGTVTPPPNTFPGLVNLGTQTAQGNIPIGQTAEQIAQGYGKQIADVQKQAAGLENAYGTTPGMAFPTSQGLTQNAAQTAGQLTSGLAAAEQAALQGTGQALTAQQQAQQGILTASGQIQPSGNFPFVFNPATGSFSAPSVGGQPGSTAGAPTLTYNPQTDATNLAKAVINKQIPYSDAVSAMGYAKDVGTGLLQTAIVAQGGNVTDLEAQAAAQQSNIQTAGTAQTQAANTAYGQYYNQALQVNQALNQVQSLGGLALQTEQGGNINPFTVQAGNATLAQIRRQLSSPAQGQFDQTMATFQGALSQLFSGSADVTPTQISTWSTQISNGTMPVQTLQAIYNQAIKEGNLKVNNILQTGASAYQQIQQGAGGGSTQSSTSSGGWGSITYK